MRITKLSLTNFKSFKQEQTIEFAPVTLLFGPNSVGKSSVLMALFYLQQILDKGQCDPQRIEALGGKLVGGFKNLVHRRNLNQSITLKIEYDKGNRVGSSYDFLADLLEEGELDVRISSPVIDVEKVTLEFVISWAEQHQTAYVANYKVWFDGVEIAEVSSDAGLKQPQITSLNYLHPLLLPDNHDDWLIDFFENDMPISNALHDKLLSLLNLYNPSHHEIKDGATRPFDGEDKDLLFTDDCFVSPLQEALNGERDVSNQFDSADNMVVVEGETLIHVPIGIEGLSGALPPLGRKLKSSLSLDNEKQNEVFVELLSDILVAPLDNLKKLLNDSLCIGPLREIPDSLHQPNPHVEQKDWHNGLGAWDSLSHLDWPVLLKIDDWMVEPEKLGLGVGLGIRFDLTKSFEATIRRQDTDVYDVISQKLSSEQKKRHEITDMESEWLEYFDLADSDDEDLSHVFEQFDSDDFKLFLKAWREKTDDFLEYNSRRINELNSFLGKIRQGGKKDITLWDVISDMEVKASDVGVGISQLMPLIVATLTKKGLIACEQPELHVHPRIQVAIGDLLTQTGSSSSFLIETHSEHLILRLLKRIRQTTDGELPYEFEDVSKDDISINYIESTNDGVKVRRIPIDEDGEFTEKWPHGFFSERREEYL